MVVQDYMRIPTRRAACCYAHQRPAIKGAEMHALRRPLLCASECAIARGCMLSAVLL